MDGIAGQSVPIYANADPREHRAKRLHRCRQSTGGPTTQAGRPLGSEEEQAVAATFAHQVPAAERPAPVEPVDLDLSAESSHASELLGIALEVPSLVNTASPEQDTAKDSSPIPSEPEQTSGEQIDVNDIFTSVR